MNTHFFRERGLAYTTILLTAMGLVAASSCTADARAPSEGAEVEDVDDTAMTLEEFTSRVYQEPGTGVFIVDGDTPIQTHEQLMEFYERHVQAGALVVNLNGAADDKWSNVQKLNLTYCVSTAFGANATLVIQAMAQATAAWQDAANVKFVYASSQNSSCNASNNNVVFDVSPTTGKPYLARAFFPSYSRAARNILINSTSFGAIAPYTLTGILRHELGHALGFRHEHTRPEAGMCFEDNKWRALTTYDSASVMHYPSCNGANPGDLVLTAKDVSGAKALYGSPPSACGPCAAGKDCHCGDVCWPSNLACP